MLADPTGREAEQIRALRWSLDLANADHGARAIMVTSAMDEEGKSTTLANLAIALARAGRRVVVIDADLARPHVQALRPRPAAGADGRRARGHVADGRAPAYPRGRRPGKADDDDRRIERPGTLEVLPAGSMVEDPDELGFDRAMGRIIERAGRADIVLVDTSPLLRSNAIALSAHVDAIVVVVRLKGLRTPALEEMGWMLEEFPQPSSASSSPAPTSAPAPRMDTATASSRSWSPPSSSRRRARASAIRRPPLSAAARRVPVPFEAQSALRRPEPARSSAEKRGKPASEVHAAVTGRGARRGRGSTAHRADRADRVRLGAGRTPERAARRAGPRESARATGRRDDDLGSGPGGLTLQQLGGATTSPASARLEVAAGEGAFRRWSTRSARSNQKSSKATVARERLSADTGVRSG